MEAEIKNPLGYERIGKLVRRFAIPSIISLVFNSIYNIVDQIFIGQKLGYLGNAATNIIFPLTVLGIAFSLMFGEGGSAYISLQLGRGEKEKAARGAGNAVMMSVCLGALLGVVVLVYLAPLCRLLGGTELVMPYALEYGRIIALGLPFTVFAGCGNALIRADSRPKLSMLSMLVGAVTNIILDPIFIFVFNWDMAGAAWATIIGQMLSAMITFICLLKTKNVKITQGDLILKWKTIKKVAGLGVSSFITQAAVVIVVSLSNILLTNYGAVSAYGAEIPLAAHGITMKVNQIVMSICIGLAVGCQPIMGFNYGAKQYGRVRKTVLISVTLSMICMAIATIIYQAAPMSIIRLFGSESDLYNEFAVKSFRIFLSGSILNGLQICTGIFFQAIGKPLIAATNSLCRQVVFIIPATITLCRLIGVEGVLWAGPVADGLAFFVALVCLIKGLKELKTNEGYNGEGVLAHE